MKCFIASLLKSRISNFKSTIKVGPTGPYLFIVLGYFPHPYSHAHDLCVEPWSDFSLDPPLAASYRICPSVVSRTVHETCAAIWDTSKEKGYLTPLSTKEDWRKVSKTYEERWNFPHALGAIDGKHVVMRCPARGGSDYFNYKKTHSIVFSGGSC